MSEENNIYDNNNGETQYTQAPEPTYTDMNGQNYGGGMGNYGSGKDTGKGFGIASMVCGIIALVTCCLWFTCIPLAILSIVFGIIQLVRCESKGMAIAGIVCSAVALLLLISLTIYGAYLESSGFYQQFYQEFMNEMERNSL